MQATLAAVQSAALLLQRLTVLSQAIELAMISSASSRNQFLQHIDDIIASLMSPAAAVAAATKEAGLATDGFLASSTAAGVSSIWDVSSSALPASAGQQQDPTLPLGNRCC